MDVEMHKTRSILSASDQSEKNVRDYFVMMYDAVELLAALAEHS